ncbi:unnamed protein product [Heligmosomoides polygyrus]|uniref:Ovule protein n=1 Tax=Heligmosomoides polygyrus TaxID=6339 RepID=A0A3P8A6K9_HELPZ|nr:unnamed protein product [Heligmosomoides polygyrus]
MVLSGGLAVSRLALSHDDHDEFGGILSCFEDSSSISSGISENFDDVSTDDLSGTDHPMATVAAAYGKLGDYQSFTRSTLKARYDYSLIAESLDYLETEMPFPFTSNYPISFLTGPRSSSSHIDSRAKRIAEQENIHQLLQQCRTSQRGAACQVNSSVSIACCTFLSCSPVLNRKENVKSPSSSTAAGFCLVRWCFLREERNRRRVAAVSPGTLRSSVVVCNS